MKPHRVKGNAAVAEQNHLQPENKTFTTLQDASNSLEESCSLSSLTLTLEAFPNPGQSEALGNAAFQDREWANVRREKEKMLFPFFPQTLNRADNEMNFIYSLNISGKTPSHTNQAIQLTFLGVHLP